MRKIQLIYVRVRDGKAVRLFIQTSKKRGRKRKPGRPVGWRKQVKPQSEVDDLESITAQTATNLKAFRLLFASHDEEVRAPLI